MLKYSKFVPILMRFKKIQITEHGEVATVWRIVLNVTAASTLTGTN